MNGQARRAAIYLGLLGLAALALGGWLRATSVPEWLPSPKGDAEVAGRPWMVEADCYSQLARVQRIAHGGGLIQNHFTVENWPEGLVPSTTAPFDYCILLLAAPLALLTAHPLDWAGVLISPLLWAGLVIFWTLFRSRSFTRWGRSLLVLGTALLPPLVWATAFGRPRHQSLIMALMAVGLTLEYERWEIGRISRRSWDLAAGIVWGLACWTSLFEPLVVVVLLVVFNLAARRREAPVFLISFGTVMLLALLLEGVHIFVPTAEESAPLVRWLATIQEMQPLTFRQMMAQLTLGFAAIPFVAAGLLLRGGERRTDLFLVLLTLVLTVLAAWESRWIYYAALGGVFLLARFCQLEPRRWTRAAVLFVFLIGVIGAWVEKAGSTAVKVHNQPSPQLVEVSRAIDAPGGIMAPWWLSPGLLYFSGHPIVSGSSHCGISGIVASAKFFTTTSWVEAEKILQERQVRWIVVFDDPRLEYPLFENSCRILGKPLGSDDDVRRAAYPSIAQILIEDRFVPTSLRLRAVTPELKLYEFLPGGD